jgi:hypothetical protein
MSSRNNNNNSNTNTMSNKKAARMHENEAIEKAKDTREECEAAISSASSGMMHFVKSICCAGMDQWQQMVAFLAPYIHAVTSYPRKFLSKEAIKGVYNDLQAKFLDYSFTKFVADMVNIMLTIMLLPLTLMVVFWRTVWNRFSYWFGVWFGPDMTLTDCINWVFSTLISCKDWTLRSMGGLMNGELTWQQVWNDSLDNSESMLQKGMTRFGEDSYLTWGVRKLGFITILRRLHVGSATVAVVNVKQD